MDKKLYFITFPLRMVNDMNNLHASELFTEVLSEKVHTFWGDPIHASI